MSSANNNDSAAGDKPAGQDRVAGDLAQHGCSMTGFVFQLAGMPGRLSIVIFGERDCANAMPRLRAKTASDPEWNVFSAHISESDVVAGTAEKTLEQCLRAVAALDGSRLVNFCPPKALSWSRPAFPR